MVVSTRRWALSNWIQLGCLIGLTACLGCRAKFENPDRSAALAIRPSGRQLLADGKLAEAEAAFDQAIATNPQDALALFYRANARERLGKTDLAISGYAEAIRLHKQIIEMKQVPPESQPVSLGSELAHAYVSLAALRNKTGKADEALEDFTEALRVDPKLAGAYCGRGAVFLAKGFAELAIDDLTEAIRLASGSHEAICLRARARLAIGDDIAAAEDAQLAIRIDPKCGDAFRTLGSALLHRPSPRPDRAIEYFKRAICLNKNLATQLNPELAKAYFDCGVSLDKIGKHAEAEKAFGEAEQLDSKYADARRERSPKAPEANSDPRVHTALKPIEQDTKLSELNRQACASLAQGNLDKALGEFTNILRIDDKCADALYGRGVAFLEKGFPDSAVQDFNRAIRLTPNSAQTYCQRGRAFAQIGNYYRAIQDTTEAIRLKPDFALAYFHRANAYLNTGSSDLALTNLHEALRRDPELAVSTMPCFAEAYRSQAGDFIATRCWDKAIVSLEKAIEYSRKTIPTNDDMAKQINRQLAQAYRERGDDHANHHQFEKAVRDLRNALVLDRENPQTYRVCGLTCCKMARWCHNRGLADEKKQWEAAVDHLDWAIRLDPELKYALQVPLNEANRNLYAISPPTETMRRPGL